MAQTRFQKAGNAQRKFKFANHSKQITTPKAKFLINQKVSLL